MPLTEAYNPAIISLQSSPDTKVQKGTDKIIPQSLAFYTPKSESTVKIQTALASLEIFTIKFRYLTRIYHTKVMKVKYGGNNAIYKVVLFSILCSCSSICWFEQLSHGWVILLGNEIDEGLKEAITAAIRCRDELA